jgi:hypothetical protein
VRNKGSYGGMYTQCGLKVLGLTISKIEDTRLFFLIQNKLFWHIYRLLRRRTVSEKLPKIPLFGPSLIHQLRFYGSQQHLQSGVILTLFLAWGTENSLADLKLESTGCIFLNITHDFHVTAICRNPQNSSNRFSH